MALNANALVTLAFAKTYLKIPQADTTQDSMVEFLINAVSDLFEGETDRKLKSQSHTEYYDGKRSNIILLNEYPVTAIASIKLDSTGEFSGEETTIDEANYSIGDGGNSVIYNTYFPSGFNNVQIVYTAGYSTIPFDIQNSALWAISYYYMMRENKDIGRTSKGKGDESVQILQTLPDDVLKTLSRYQRIEIGTSRMGRNG